MTFVVQVSHHYESVESYKVHDSYDYLNHNHQRLDISVQTEFGLFLAESYVTLISEKIHR